MTRLAVALSLLLATHALAADGPTVVVPDIRVHVGEFKRITLGLRDSAPGRAYDFDLTFAPEGIALSQIQGSWPLMTTSYESCAELHSISAGGELRISAVCPTTRVRNGTLFALTVRGVLPGRSILMARDCAVGDVSPDAVPYDATVQCAESTFGDVEVLP